MKRIRRLAPTYPIPFDVRVHVGADMLAIELSTTAHFGPLDRSPVGTPVYSATTVRLPDLRARHDFTYYAILTEALPPTPGVPVLPAPRFLPPLNVLAATAPDHINPTEWGARMGLVGPVSFMLPSVKDSFLDAHWFFKKHPQHQFACNLPDLEDDEGTRPLADVWPRLSMSSVRQEGHLDIEITCFDYTEIPEVELYLESTAGYLPRRRVPLVYGRAHATWLPLGLRAGEAARIKVGTRYISGLADIEVSA